MKIKFYLDSGANNSSCYEVIVSLDDLGLTKKQWKNMSDEDKDSLCRDIAFERADWGWEEIKD